MTRSSIIALFGLSACLSPLPDQPDGSALPDAAAPEARVAFDPPSDASAAPRVVRIHLGVNDASPVGLYEGELGEYHLRRIARDDLPKTLVERSIPTLTWAEDGGVVVAPTRPLDVDAAYALASPLGLHSTLRVANTGPVLMRTWPPYDGGIGARHAVFCADAAAPFDEHELSLDPLGVRAVISGGADRFGRGVDPCVRLSLLATLRDGERVLPPPSIGGYALDPAPFVGGSPSTVSTACPHDHAAFLGGCFEVLDDRAVLTASVASFWVVEGPRGRTLSALAAGERFVVRGLSPNRENVLRVTRIDHWSVDTGQLVLATRTAQPHLVLAEVMANPVGPEPAQEWVELVNDGAESVDLEGWWLVDVGGETTLPAAVIEPGERVLVVSEPFDAASRWDVPPKSGTALVRVEEVGKNGLANSGEPLELRSPDGRVVSRFPPVPKPKSGVSVARRSPSALDSEPTSFGRHAPPGASPGAANELE